MYNAAFCCYEMFPDRALTDTVCTDNCCPK
jgi:hypothetical protein